MIQSIETLAKLIETGAADVGEIVGLLETRDADQQLIYSAARELTDTIHGNKILLRGIIEFSNICQSDCLYCGIRAGAPGVRRYRMTSAEIMACVHEIKHSHCGTVVLQSGVDNSFTVQQLAEIIHRIKDETRLAVTLSIGTRTREELTLLREAGADRFLLRFETCDSEIFRKIHPFESFECRVACIRNLSRVGLQSGSGFMIGLPGTDLETIARDILFTRELNLDMIGCGPFIPSPGTPLASESLLHDLSIYYKTMALIRIMNPYAHIPATTAFDSLLDGGRDEVLKCGANVFMPNFTPPKYKEFYNLYPGKPSVDTSTDIYQTVKQRIEKMERCVSSDVGHALRLK
jgi:biotin synthase